MVFTNKIHSMKTIKFTAVTIFIIATRAYDYMCTQAFTPDLSKESNPLVSVFGFHWTRLMTILIVLGIYVIYAYYVSLFSTVNILPAEKGLSFKEFATYVYLGHQDSWLAILWKLPNSFTRFNVACGSVLCYTVVWAGVITTGMWLLINNTNWYYQSYHKPGTIISIIILGGFTIMYLNFKKLYRNYCAIK